MDARQRNLRRERKREFEYGVMRINERQINCKCGNLSSFKDLQRREQGMLLLKRVAFLFGKQTFDPYKALANIGGYTHSNELVRGFASNEQRDAELYLLTYPWSEIMCSGYVAEAPPGSGMYEITAKGWVAIQVDDDIMPL
jgi:hypothetical protein